MRVFIRVIKLYYLIGTVLCCLAYGHAHAESALLSDTAAVSDQSKERGLIGRFVQYMAESNKPKRNKALDFSIIGGPHYSSDRGFGVGLVAAGLYSTDRADTLLQPSNVALAFDATSKKYFTVGIINTTIFKQDRRRLEAEVKLQSFDTKYWGIGYDMDRDDANESDYKYLRVHVAGAFVWQLARGFFVGPLAGFDYIKGSRMDNPELWLGQDSRTVTVGAGFTLRYDTRDFAPNPYRGVYIAVDQRFNPSFIGNTCAYSATDVWLRYFRQFWSSGVVAFMYRGQFTCGDIPWGMLPTFGGGDFMRAYYEGRYRDKNSMIGCVELRQRIYHRIGLAAWIGAGVVFPDFKHLQMRRVLPDCGIGYRWEFKKRVNVRVDFGIGKHSTGFVFSINEAF